MEIEKISTMAHMAYDGWYIPQEGAYFAQTSMVVFDCPLYPLYTGAATSVPPLCDHKTVQVAVEGRREAERFPWSFKGTQDVQASPWTPWSPWSFEHVQNSHTKVAEEVGRSQVAQRRQDEGTHIAVVAEWMHSGRPLVAQLKCEHCVSIWATRLPSLYHHCASFGRPMASIERSLWRPLCLHSATTATLEPPWRWFCLHSAIFARPVVPLQQLWSFKEGTRVVLQQLHRNRTFWVPATTERPNHFYIKVAQGWHEGRSPV